MSLQMLVSSPYLGVNESGNESDSATLKKRRFLHAVTAYDSRGLALGSGPFRSFSHRSWPPLMAPPRPACRAFLAPAARPARGGYFRFSINVAGSCSSSGRTRSTTLQRSAAAKRTSVVRLGTFVPVSLVLTYVGDISATSASACVERPRFFRSACSRAPKIAASRPTGCIVRALGTCF